MSKRLQVLLPAEEYKKISRLSAIQKKTIADWVRESIRLYLSQQEPQSPDAKLSKILKFARYTGPTGDIEGILSDIEKGRDGK